MGQCRAQVLRSPLNGAVQGPGAEKTPEWGVTEGSRPNDTAAAKGWRGQAAYEDDWGELNTNKKAPTLFLLDTQAASLAQVRLARPAAQRAYPAATLQPPCSHGTAARAPLPQQP